MTIFKKLVNIVITTALIMFMVGWDNYGFAQLSNEQKNQVNEYNKLIKQHKSKNEIKSAVYYSNKRASVYLKAGSYQEAINSYSESVQLNEQIGNSRQNRKIFLNMAFIYSEMNQLRNTQKYFDQALAISRRYNNREDICVDIMNGTNIMILKKEHTQALAKLEEALKIAHNLNNAKLLRECYRQMALCYKGYGDNKRAAQNYEMYEAYDKHVKEKGVIIREEEKNKTIKDREEVIDKVTSEKDAKILALKVLELNKKRSEDSLNNALTAAEKTRKIIELEKEKAEREKEEQKRLTEYQEALVEAEKSEKELYILYLWGGAAGIVLLLLLIVGAAYTLRQRRKANQKLEQQNVEIAKQKDEIETKSFELQDALGHIQVQQKSIMQSINYAQRIQDAMLPKQLGMKEMMPESFIYFKPRDVVSGDFYWFDEINRRPRNGKRHPAIEDENFRRIFIAAVDCTGHGVPGAFMSMLGFNLLNDIVRRGTLDSDKILNALHKGIRKSLNQDQTQNRDGMDMALCAIDPVNKTMEYSGAQNPLIYIQDGQLFRVRGNKFPVGGYQMEEHDFTKHVIDIDKPTTCYIFSDGFPDQFGGPNGRKFMAKNFRDLLFEIYQMPMEEQEKILDLVINEWMGNNEQTDDILVMGFRIDIKDDLLYAGTSASDL